MTGLFKIIANKKKHRKSGSLGFKTATPNKTVPKRLRKILKKTTKSTKKPSQPTENLLKLKKEIENKFATTNSELAQQSTSGELNIFMDILKVAPVINIEDETERRSLITNGEKPINRQSTNVIPLVDLDSDEKDTSAIILNEENEMDSMAVWASDNGSDSAEDCVVIPVSTKGSEKGFSSSGNTHTLSTAGSSRPTVSGSGHGHGSNKTIATRIRHPQPTLLPEVWRLRSIHSFRQLQPIAGTDVLPTINNAYDELPLTILSYNVLCQQTMEDTSFLYNHLIGERAQLKAWESRWRLLQLELDKANNAQVFCLQEVQNNHYAENFLPYFEKKGFKGFYTKRTDLSRKTVDGCAIFFNPAYLNLISQTDVFFNLRFNGIDKDNIGQISVFNLVNANVRVCITNTHILYNMKRGEIKLAQFALLLSKIHETELWIQDRSTTDGIHFAGHILCGDFNIEPYSPIYRFIVDGCIDLRAFNDRRTIAFEVDDLRWAFAPRTTIQYQPILPLPLSKMRVTNTCTMIDLIYERQLQRKSAEVIDPALGQLFNQQHILTHQFTFASVYDYRNIQNEREVSTFHHEVGAPDFIFYSVAGANPTGAQCAQQGAFSSPVVRESLLRLRSRLVLPTLSQLQKSCGRLPNEASGSDHLPILATFDVLSPKTNCR